MCKRPDSAMHYYLEEVNGIWEARNHWGELLATDSEKTQVRKKVEDFGYLCFR